MARLDLARLRDLIRVATESDAAEVEIEEKGVRVLVRKQATQVLVQPPYAMQGYPGTAPPQPPFAPQIVPAQPVITAPEPAKESQGTVVCAPIVGTFFRRPAPEADPFVEVGSTVAAGDTLCIIEAMKNMNEVESDVAGTVSEILVQDSEAVSYDQPLFVIS